MCSGLMLPRALIWNANVVTIWQINVWVFNSCRVVTLMLHNIPAWCALDWYSSWALIQNANVKTWWQLNLCLTLKVFKSCRVTTQLFHNFCTWCYKDWCSLQSRRLNANVVAIWQLKVCLSLILTCCRVVINSVVPHQIPASCALDWCFLWSLTRNTTMVTMATMFV